jgi:hypothetical protein
MSEQAQAVSRSPAAAALAAAAGALVPPVLFLLGCAYTAWPGAFNADHLYPSAVCEDVRLGRPFGQWHFPGAPYLFPDMLLLLPCQLLPGGVAGEFIGYVFALFLSLLAAVAWLGREVGLTRRQALGAAAGGVLLLAAAHLDKAYEWRGTHIASPGSHVGIIPVGIALLALAVRLLRRGPRVLPVAAFLVLGALGAFSDKLLLVQFLAPLAAALVLLACVRVFGIKPLAGMLGLVGGVALLSAGLRVAFVRLGFHLLRIEDGFLSAVKLGDLPALLGQVCDGVAGQPLLAAFMPLYLLAGAAAVAVWLRRRTEGASAGPDRRGALVAALTLVLLPPCDLGVLFAAGLSQRNEIWRYMLPCYLLPLLLTGWLLGLLPGRGARLGRVVIPALAVLVAGWRLAERGRELAALKVEPPYPPLARVLDRLVRERGPMRGLAEFWVARPMQFLTRERVVVAPLDANGLPFFHASNPARFLADDPRDTSVPPYRFVVVGPGHLWPDPGPAMVSLLYGLPRERIPAGEYEVWLYDQLHSTPLDRFLRAQVAERLRARDPGTGPASPSCLARAKANMTPADAPGNILLGPDEGVEVRFAGPVTGKVLDVGAGHDQQFDLTFFAGAERVGRLAVPTVPFTGAVYESAGIQSRLLPLPPALQARPWDRVVVRPRPGSGPANLGHLLVRAGDVPETGVGPSQRVPRIRLEAECLQTHTRVGGDHFADSTPEPGASGGRVRQAATDFRGVVSFTKFVSLPAGRYRVDFAVRVDDNTSPEDVALLDAVCFVPPAAVASRPLRGSDFPAAGRFVRQSLELNLEEDRDYLLFRLVAGGKTAVALDYIDVVALPAGSSGHECRGPKPPGGAATPTRRANEGILCGVPSLARRVGVPSLARRVGVPVAGALGWGPAFGPPALSDTPSALARRSTRCWEER